MTRGATTGLMQCSKYHVHSITSSARTRNDSAIVSPRAFAVLRLITNSNSVGCSMGRSAGLAPFKRQHSADRCFCHNNCSGRSLAARSPRTHCSTLGCRYTIPQHALVTLAAGREEWCGSWCRLGDVRIGAALSISPRQCYRQVRGAWVPFWQFNEAVRGVPIRRRRDRDQRWSL